MKRSLFKLGAALLALAFSAGAGAVPLQDLFNGATITAGDKLFDRWTLNLADASDPAFDPDFSQVDVTPLNDGGNDPGPGLRFDLGTEFDLTGNDFFSFIDASFGFRVTTLGNERIKDNSLLLEQAVVTLTGNNGSTIVETIGTTPGGNDLGTKIVEFSFLDGLGTTQITNASAEFDPQTEIFVTKNILVFADLDERAGIFSFTQRFSQVPEPGTTALLAAGLLAGGLARRRRAVR